MYSQRLVPALTLPPLPTHCVIIQHQLQKQSTRLHEQEVEIEKAKVQLVEAQRIVSDVMGAGGSMLEKYAIPHSALERGSAIGEGSFGEWLKALSTSLTKVTLSV